MTPDPTDPLAPFVEAIRQLLDSDDWRALFQLLDEADADDFARAALNAALAVDGPYRLIIGTEAGAIARDAELHPADEDCVTFGCTPVWSEVPR